MLNLLNLVGEVFKSNLVSGIISALISNSKVTAPDAEITATVSSAASNASVASAAQSVASAIVPSLRTWTPEELAAAESAWAAQQEPGNATLNAAFSAGVVWAVSHQTATLTNGIANEVAAHTGISAGTVQAVEEAALNVAGAAATGGAGAAAVAAVGEVVKAVEAAGTGKVADNDQASSKA